ncbi:hypothetical protein L3V82_12620 [Thiotrichales bacterium 19S3-7]|nr:hypothetical protein [Thiotrichales bacterium 19S3-7]MCF6802788.1 hypothetical protein [Thiotrichales bacterium 19S3-11]
MMQVKIIQPIILELQARKIGEIVTIKDENLCNRLLKSGYVKACKGAKSESKSNVSKEA